MPNHYHLLFISDVPKAAGDCAERGKQVVRSEMLYEELSFLQEKQIVRKCWEKWG